MKNIIELKNIKKEFEDGFVAVEDFNLEVEKGSFVTFLGPSGCGKTTTLRMIAGFDLPSEGEILLNGQDISKLPPNKRPINTVFQRYALFPHLNVIDNVAFGLKLKKMPKEEILRKVKKALEIVDLEGFEKRKIQTLSGGQQQRIAIARAIVNEPEILLLDEPLGALDLKMRKEMQIELKNIHDKLGITFIYVTHDQEEALTMSDKIVVMSEGKIQQIGTPEDIYNEPKNAFVADFIGDSNVFNGVMTDKLKVRFCGHEFDCLDDVAHGTMVDAVVRPEDVIITTPDKGMITGRVASVVFKGVHYEITIMSGKNEIVVQSTKKSEVGEEVGIVIEPDGIHVMIAEHTINKIETYIQSNYKIEFFENLLADHDMEFDIAQIIPGSHWENDVVFDNLLDAHNEPVDVSKYKVVVSIGHSDIEMTDNVDEGIMKGHIINLIYKGDHYSYVVRTDDDIDLVVNDEDLWNMEDYVGLIIPKDSFKLSIKK